MTPAAHRKPWPIVRRTWQAVIILTFIAGAALLVSTLI